jgi:hypothetical protein
MSSSIQKAYFYEVYEVQGIPETVCGWSVKIWVRWIWGSQSGDCKEYNLLGYNAMHFDNPTELETVATQEIVLFEVWIVYLQATVEAVRSNEVLNTYWNPLYEPRPRPPTNRSTIP